MAEADCVFRALLAAGFHTFKSPEQEDATRSVVAGHDVFAALPTGSGKTLIFRLAAACRGGVAVVVSPLLSLIEDQLNRARLDGISACTFTGSTSKKAKGVVQEKLLAGSEPTILYITAEMAVQPNFRAFYSDLVARNRLSLLCVDEAHVCCWWAEHFRPAYARLGELRGLSSTVPLLMLTATATRSGIDAICRLLRASSTVKVLQKAPRRANLFIDVVRTDRLAHGEVNAVAFVVRVLDRTNDGVAIVYCRSKSTCDYYALRFKEFGVRARLYHGDRSKSDRALVQQNWTNEGVRVIVATVAFGLGIDKSNVRCIVHVDLPNSLQSYAQEIGRGGRDGARAFCRVYLSSSEKRSAAAIVQQERRLLTGRLGSSASAKVKIDDRCKEMMKGFKEVFEFANASTECRHRRLDKHFGFSHSPDCQDNCDYCCSHYQ